MISKLSPQAMKRFKVIRHIAEGSYGEVDEVEVTEDFSSSKHTFVKGERYALKRFKMADECISADGVREIDLLNTVDQPNLLSALYTYAVKEGGRYSGVRVVLPLATQNLFGYMGTEGRFSEGDVVKIIHQLLCALAYLHNNFIVHEDVKLENILMFGKIPVLADYGMSVFVNSTGSISTNSQTIIYRPPELLEDPARLHAYESDIWAAGGVLYELAAYQLFMDSDDVGEILEGTKTLPTRIELAETSGEIKQLLRAMLNPNPKERITARDALQLPIFKDLNCPPAKFESIPWKINIRDMPMRKAFVRWLWELRESILRVLEPGEYLPMEQFFLAVDIFDRILSRSEVPQKQMQLAAAVALSLAANIYGPDIISPGDYVDITAGMLFDEETLIEWRCYVFEVLEWRVYRPPINTIFPDADIGNLVNCYFDYPSPDEIRKCIDQ